MYIYKGRTISRSYKANFPLYTHIQRGRNANTPIRTPTYKAYIDLAVLHTHTIFLVK